MPVIVVANPKGGVGKSTLSTNLAGYLARAGHAVMLGDVDRQQSSRPWLALRPRRPAAIAAWEVSATATSCARRKGTTHVVLDTPAGLHGKRLDEVMKLADKVLVPLQPSIFDIHATHDFIDRAAGAPAQRQGAGRRGRHAHARRHDLDRPAAQLPRRRVDVPVLGYLRDTQNYVHLAARGLTLWDVAPSRVERDLRAVGADHRLAAAMNRTMRSFETSWPTCSRWSARRSASATGSPSTRSASTLFADATGDHQWIHVDAERATAGPFGTTIAHGFLTLSLLPEMSASAFEVRDDAHGRQLRPEPGALPGAGAGRTAGCAGASSCSRYEPLDGGAQLTVEVTIEREGSAKPVCVAESIARRFA